MMASGKKVKKKDMEFIHGLKELAMMASGRMDKKKVMEFSKELMEKRMMAIGKMETVRVMVLKSIPMVTHTKDSGVMVRNKAAAYTHIT